jgi:hypothetical protein
LLSFRVGPAGISSVVNIGKGIPVVASQPSTPLQPCFVWRPPLQAQLANPALPPQVLCYAAVSSDPELAARLIVNRAVADWHTHHPLKDEIEPRDDTTAVVLCLRRDGAGRRSGRAAAELGTPGNEKCKCSLM